MKRKKKHVKRVMAMLLAGIMTINTIPINIFASELESENETWVEEEVQTQSEMQTQSETQIQQEESTVAPMTTGQSDQMNELQEETTVAQTATDVQQTESDSQQQEGMEELTTVQDSTSYSETTMAETEQILEEVTEQDQNEAVTGISQKNLALYITQVMVVGIVDGQWQEKSEFTDGESAQIKISCMIPSAEIGQDNMTFVYQLPDGTYPENDLEGSIFNEQQSVAGTYQIMNNGSVILQLDQSMADKSIDLTYNTVLTSNEAEKDVVFAGANDTAIKTIKIRKDIIAQGESEDGSISWKLNMDGALKIEGTGTVGVGDWSSYRDSITSVEIGEGITEIGSSAFRGYTNLESVKLPESLQLIDNSAFNNCWSLSGTLVIPDNVTEIGGIAFVNCYSLKEIIFGKSLEKIEGIYRSSIGQNYYTAFQGCSGVEQVTFKSEQPPIITRDEGRMDYWYVGLTFGTQDFKNIKCITVPAQSYSDYTTEYGQKLSKVIRIKPDMEEPFLIENGVLVAYSQDGPVAEVPDGVTEIGKWAFTNNTTIEQVNLPDSVTVIDEQAFANCSSLKSVRIPESLNEINKYAFYNCTNLKEAAITKNLTKIGAYAFNGCQNLEGTIGLGENLTELGEYAFGGCSKLTGDLVIPSSIPNIARGIFSGCSGLNGELVLPEGVLSIGESAFSGCSNLKGLNIPDSVTEIGSDAFYNCQSFAGELILPSSVKSIKDSAFLGCRGFTGALRIPDSVETLGSFAFGYCSGFTKVIIGTSALDVQNAFRYSGNIETVQFLSENPPKTDFRDMNGLKQVVVPVKSFEKYFKSLSLRSGIKIVRDTDADFVIEDGVLIYYGGSNEEVIIPDSVKRIENFAFYNNNIIKTVVIPDSVIEIGENAFQNCTELTTVELSSEITTIGNYAFYGCGNLKGTLVLPEKLTSLGDCAFSGTSISGDLVIPEGIERIGASVFANCSSLDGTLILPQNLKKIGNSAFYNCTSIKGELTLPDGLETIGDSAFAGCKNITGALTIPETVTTIESSAFERSGIEKISSWPASVTTIKANMFSGCTSLSGRLIIPDSVTKIENDAFSNCTGITDIVFGRGLTNIYSYVYGSNGFNNCPAVETITFLGEKPPYINNSIWSETNSSDSVSRFFNDTRTFKNLKTIYVPDDSYQAYVNAYGKALRTETRIKTINGGDFIIENQVLISYVGNEEQVTIPEGIVKIGDYAFLNNNMVTFVEVPESVIEIGKCAFEGCTALTSFEMPKQMESIGDSAFEGCTELAVELQLPKTVSVIGNRAFYNCSKLTGSLIFSDSIEQIGEDTFHGCSGLNGELSLPKSLKKIGNQAFYNCSSLKGELALPEGLELIGNSAFSGCSNLKGSLKIPDSVTSIGNYAFYNCSGFDGTLVLSENLQTINSNTFYGCSGLNGALKIPNSVTSISERAFSGDKGFNEIIVGDGVQYIYAVRSWWGEDISAFDGCTNVKNITFIGQNIPRVAASDTENVGCLFSTEALPNLKTIYVRPDMLSAFQKKWGAYLPETISFSTDSWRFPIEALSTVSTCSHSIKLQWERSQSEEIVGYNVFRDGQLVAQVKSNDQKIIEWEDSGLEMDHTYQYKITGYTADGSESEAATLEESTQKLIIMEIRGSNYQPMVGAKNSTLTAVVSWNSGLCNLQSTTGRFYYLNLAGEKVVIAEDVLPKYDGKYMSANEYETNWDITEIGDGDYTVGFEITDKDGECFEYSQIITVDHSYPQKISQISAVGDTHKIYVSWSIAHEISTDQYNLYRRSEEDDNFVLLQQISGRSTLNYTDTKVEDNKKYYYYVVGVNGFGQEGDPSEIAVAMPQADKELPRVIQMTPANGSIIGGETELYANAQDNIEVTKTELYISYDDGNTWHLLRGQKGNYCRYILNTSAIESQIIQVKAVAYDAAGNVSNPLTCSYKIDNIGPEKVTGLTYESTPTTITLRWNDVADQDLAFFRVEEKKADGTFEKLQDVTNAAAVNLYNLDADTEYTYRVIAYDQLGNRGEESDEITAKTQSDTIAPVITQITPNAGYCNEQIQTSITAVDNTGIASILIQTSRNAVIWDDYKTVVFDGTRKSETAYETIRTKDLEEGDFYIRGVASDVFGNLGNIFNDAPYVQYIIDHTAPKIPENLKVNTENGAIELRWDMNSENDLAGYVIWRSEDGENYEIINQNCQYINYWDYTAQANKTYWYKIAVCDQAGNQSEQTEAVKAALPVDTEPPKIESFLPETGSVIGNGNNVFRVLVSDNRSLDSIKVIYKVNNEDNVQTLLIKTGIKDYYKLVEKTIPLDKLEDGDILTFSVSVTDEQGLESVSKDIIYTVDKTAPKVKEISTSADFEKISVNWTGYEENDLAGYRIYRKTANGTYVLIAQKAVVKDSCEYQYEDYTVAAKEVYYYKVEAIDKNGNVSAKETEAIWLEVKPQLIADLMCDEVLEQDVEYYFDASGSSADLGIASYQFDFGDGTVISGTDAKIIHRYKETGNYEVVLTITDVNKNTVQVKRLIRVEQPSLVGTVRVKAVTADGSPIEGMAIHFDMDSESKSIKYTDTDGYALFRASVASYVIGAYADGYLPIKKTVTLQAKTETQVELVMVKEPIVTGKFEVNRMTLQEIKAAGIDVTDPANQQVVKVTVHLVYGSQPVSMEFMTNGTTMIGGLPSAIIETDSGTRRLTATVVKADEPVKEITGGGSIGLGSISDTGISFGKSDDNIILAIMDIPIEASFLKEFFDVKLHIINHADSEFELIDNKVKLNIPEGMTLIEGGRESQRNIESFDLLRGQEEKTLSWILRGDKAGKYDLEADYSATLTGFNVAVAAKFKTDEPIEVYGLNSLKMIVDVDSSIRYGGMYFNLSLQNISGADVYLPSINVDDEVIRVYENKAGSSDVSELEAVEKKVNLLGKYLQNAQGYSIRMNPSAVLERLAPNEKFTKKYVCYNSVTSKDIAYLREAVSEIADNYGLQIEINTVNMNHYDIDNADDKAQSIWTDPSKAAMFRYFIHSENFRYYINAMADDDDWLKKASEALYQGLDAALNFDFEAFTGADTKELTLQYIYEMLQDETFQQAVDLEVNKRYLTITKSALGILQNSLLSENEDVRSFLSSIQSEQSNIYSLTNSLKTGGQEGFYNRLLNMAGSVGGTALVTSLKTFINQNSSVMSPHIASEIKGQLGELKDVVQTLDDLATAWNDSVELTNKLMVISATQYEARFLLEMILKHPEVNRPVYEEVQYIYEGLDKGFASLSSTFVANLEMIYLNGAITSQISSTIKLVDELYYPNDFGIGGVLTVFKISFGVIDKLFGWGDSVKTLKALRVAGALSYAIHAETVNAQIEGDNSKILLSLKYLIKMRLVGERNWVQISKDNNLSEIRMEDGSIISPDAYYEQIRQMILSYRDALYEEVSQNMEIPSAPIVDIDYQNEKTSQRFDESYEFSYEGTIWESCDGTEIPLAPKSTITHLWVRKKASSENAAGNIQKICIPERPEYSEDVSAKYKDGIYYITGVNSSVYYELTTEKLEKLSQQNPLEISDGEARIESKEYYPYLALALPAAEKSFASQALNVHVEKAKVVTVEGDDNQGSVSGGGEYFEGETAVVKAIAASGYRFAGWYTEDRLVAQDAEYSFIVYANLVLEARFEKIRTVKVVFKNFNKIVLSSIEYTEDVQAFEIKVPTVPILDGYCFVGWEVDGQVYTDTSQLQNAIKKLSVSMEVIELVPRLEQFEETYTLTITGGKTTDGLTMNQYRPATIVSVIADEAQDGMQFAYWEKDGVKASYDMSWRFYMPGRDTEIEAVYVKSEEQVMTKGVSYIESTTVKADIKKIIFVSIGTVPDGSRIEYSGIVATSDHNAAENLTKDNAMFVRGGGAGYKTFKCTWTKGNVTSDQTWYVRSYLKYTDASGEVHEEYGDLVSSSLRVSLKFIGYGGKELSNTVYTLPLDDSASIDVPKAAALDGYEWIGWSLDGTLYIADEIVAAIKERLVEGKSVCAEAKYEQRERLYTLTVKNGHLADGTAEGEYKQSDIVTVSADKAKDGEKFTYWLKDGSIASYDSTWRFYMPGKDIIVEAVYKADGDIEEAIGTSTIESVTVKNDIQKIIFVSVGTVPDGCTIEYSGIVATSDHDAAENLTKDNAMFVRGGGSGYKTFKCTWTKGNVTKDQIWYVRSYLKYTDAKGAIHEIYGDLISASLGNVEE